jgi:hypothetical protein
LPAERARAGLIGSADSGGGNRRAHVNKTTVVILVLIAVVCFLLVGGGVWLHGSDPEPDPHEPPNLGALGDLISGFSPRLDVGTLRIVSGAATLEKGVLTLQGGAVTILIPPSDEKVRQLDLELLSDATTSVTVAYEPSGEKKQGPESLPVTGTRGPSLRLAIIKAGGLLTISGTPIGPGQPSKVAFR